MLLPWSDLATDGERLACVRHGEAVIDASPAAAPPVRAQRALPSGLSGASTDASIDLVDARDGRWLRAVECPRTLRPHAWAFFGDSLAVADWRAGTSRTTLDGARLWAWPDLSRADTLTWLPSSQRLALGLRRRLRLLDPATGKWRVEVRGGLRASDLGQGRILVLDEAGRARAIDLDGRVAWVSPVAIEAPLRCASAGGLALLAGSVLTALDAATGAPAWTFAPGPGERVVAVSEVALGIALIATGRAAPARLVVLDHEGRARSDRELLGTAFAFLGDRVATNAGEIVRLADHARVGTIERRPGGVTG